MSSTQSVTHWLARLKSGDLEAAKDLWARYFERLVQVARAKLRGARRRVADEEDVALSALDSFFRAAADGRFPDLHDRHGLWPLLATITTRKAFKLADHERRQKRGGGAVRGESVLVLPNEQADDPSGWAAVFGREPTPAFACQMAEECQRLLDLLPDEPLRLQSIARWKMEGFTNAEIAAKLVCMERTVERKLRHIRKLWEGEGNV